MERPTRMIRNGRSVDQNFCKFHKLYYRCQADAVIDNRLLAPKLKSFDISVNWSKYSKPWDVIFGDPSAGIALFFVFDIRRDLPTDRTTEQREIPKVHSYRPVHDPDDDNYSHSEITVIKDGQRVTKSSMVGEKAKKEFRQIISDKSVMLKQPKAEASAT